LRTLKLIAKYSDQLEAAIENGSLKETVARLFEKAPENYKPALRHLTEEQLLQNLEALDAIKKNPVTAIYAFGSQEQKAQASSHIISRTVRGEELGDNSFSRIAQNLFRQNQVAV